MHTVTITLTVPAVNRILEALQATHDAMVRDIAKQAETQIQAEIEKAKQVEQQPA